jgi:hypothetical protein
MEENQFWLNVWRTVAAAFAALVLTIGGCTANQNRLVAEMVAAGADPIKAHCAIVGVQSISGAMCGAAAAGR